MPALDGVELAGVLRAQAGTRPLLLIATTALGGIEDRTRTALAGFHYHLVKPVDTSTLLDALRRFGVCVGRPAAAPRPDIPGLPPAPA
jgi:CheY-like chemotaxis protein